jgi:large subunit ribosomal protein L10
MPISKEKKKEIYKDVTDILSAKGSVVFINFHGVTVDDSITIRKKLKTEGVGYLVAKKSIVKKILKELNVPGTLPSLDGELAMVSGADLLAPAREIYDFQKKMDKKISVLGGIFDGTFMSKDEMVSIALIPSQHTLQAMFVNVISSPISGFVRALDAIAEKKTV